MKSTQQEFRQLLKAVNNHFLQVTVEEGRIDMAKLLIMIDKTKESFQKQIFFTHSDIENETKNRVLGTYRKILSWCKNDISKLQKCSLIIKFYGTLHFGNVRDKKQALELFFEVADERDLSI